MYLPDKYKKVAAKHPEFLNLYKEPGEKSGNPDSWMKRLRI
jgi:hypothetical protein